MSLTTKTVQQLQADGLTIQTGQGQRIQLWTGLDPAGNSFSALFDTVTGNYRVIPTDSVNAAETCKAIGGLAMVVIDLIMVSALTAEQKTAKVTEVLQAL